MKATTTQVQLLFVGGGGFFCLFIFDKYTFILFYKRRCKSGYFVYNLPVFRARGEASHTPGPADL